MPGRKNKGISSESKSRKSTSRPSAAPSSSSSVSKKTLQSLKESQRQLKIVLDAAHMGIWEWDLNNNKVFWSGSIEDLFLLSKETVSDSINAYIQLVHPDDKGKLLSGIKESLESPKPFFVEHRIIRKDGTIRWLEAYGNVYRNKKGKATRMTGTVQDISVKKVIEKEREDWKSRHELVSSSAGLVIYDYDIVSGDIAWSGNSFEVLGYKASELGNIDQWVKQIHQDDREEAFRLLDQAQKELRPYDVYYRFEKKNGEYCHMHDRGFFIADSKGKARRMLGMMIDVTEQRRAQESLIESELRYRTLQEASFGGIGLHDQGKIIDCNQGLCELTGYSYSELVGSNGLNLIAPEWRDFVIDKIKSGHDKTYDVQGVRKDGTQYFLEIRGKNIPYEKRTIRVTEFRDITDRKRSEEKIVEQNTRLLSLTEDLKRKNNQLEEFTQIVSHNLRSPVGNILTLLNFYEKARSREEKDEYFQLLKEASSTTLGMLNELNDILQIKQNKNIEKHELKFENVLLLIKSMLNARITELGARVSSDFEKASSVFYPPIYLESILLNLLDNALKYRYPGRTPEIQFYTYRNDVGSTILQVKDNGLGINLDRYGHQVFKLRKTFHHHPESRGIGLFMIKNQIEAMGGEISILSREHEGTSFFINFNKHQVDANEESDSSPDR